MGTDDGHTNEKAKGMHAMHGAGVRCYSEDKTTRTHEPLYSSYICNSQQDSLLYTQFSRTHPSSISSSVHYGTHLSLYLNICVI
jgi:hypothetical protein